MASLSSMAGGVGLVGGGAYGATKAALEAMTRAWAVEYSGSGVRVNAIAPGPVYTSTPSGPEFITALGETTHAPRLTTRGDRRGHRVPRFPASELHHPAPPSPPTADAERSNQANNQTAQRTPLEASLTPFPQPIQGACRRRPLRFERGSSARRWSFRGPPHILGVRERRMVHVDASREESCG